MKILPPNYLIAGLVALSAALFLKPVAAFAADDAKLKATEKADRKALKPYPLTTCIVTDNDLGSMGEETSIVYKEQIIKFCCAPCERKFLKNPGKYLPKLLPEPAK